MRRLKRWSNFFSFILYEKQHVTLADVRSTFVVEGLWYEPTELLMMCCMYSQWGSGNEKERSSDEHLRPGYMSLSIHHIHNQEGESLTHSPSHFYSSEGALLFCKFFSNGLDMGFGLHELDLFTVSGFLLSPLQHSAGNQTKNQAKPYKILQRITANGYAKEPGDLI